MLTMCHVAVYCAAHSYTALCCCTTEDFWIFQAVFVAGSDLVIYLFRFCSNILKFNIFYITLLSFLVSFPEPA